MKVPEIAVGGEMLSDGVTAWQWEVDSARGYNDI